MVLVVSRLCAATVLSNAALAPTSTVVCTVQALQQKQIFTMLTL